MTTLFSRTRRPIRAILEIDFRNHSRPALFPSAIARRRAPIVAHLRPRERGYLMIECLVYMMVLVFIMGVGFGAFYQCLTNSRDLNRNADDIVRALKAGERWRSDIRAAVAEPTLKEQDGAVLLEIPQAADSVIYTFRKETLWRSQGPQCTAQKLLTEVLASNMRREARSHVTSWQWDLELKTKKRLIRVKPLFSFQAVPEEIDTYETAPK